MTRQLDADSPELTELRLADLSSYLRSVGWSIERRSPLETVWLSPADEDRRSLRAALPTSEQYDDWGIRLARIVEMLSEMSSRTPIEVVRSVRAVARDIVFVSVDGPKASSGSIGLGDAAAMISQHWNLLSYSACAEEDPLPYFEKARKIGRTQADKCYFGHTFHGSFGITIESPLPPQPRPTLFHAVAPIERRVIERVARGFQHLDASVNMGDLEPLVVDYKHGLNANMCDVLIALGQHFEGSQLTYRFAWSPRLPPSADVSRAEAWQVGDKSLQFLEAASHALRRSIETQGARLIGKITKLQSEDPPAFYVTGDARTITVYGAVPGSQKLHVRVALGPVEYAAACDAHKLGQDVSVIGTLEKDGKFWVLRSPTDFAVIGESEG